MTLILKRQEVVYHQAERMELSSLMIAVMMIRHHIREMQKLILVLSLLMNFYQQMEKLKKNNRTMQTHLLSQTFNI